MWESSVNLSKEPVIRETDEQGRFVYEDMDVVEFVVSAKKQGYGKSERKRYHLYFKKQNFELPEPLVLTGE